MRSRPPGGEQNRDREELAFLLPFFGTLLVLPPLVNLFVGRQLLVLGVPLDTLYLFSVWLALVIGAMLLSRRAPKRKRGVVCCLLSVAGRAVPGPVGVRVGPRRRPGRH